MPPNKVRILLVEDDPDDAELVASLLRDVTMETDLVREGLLALGLRRLNSEKFDLVLLDMSLPDSWGMDTLRRMRRSHPDLPVVLMTGATMAEVAEEASREGAIACVFKRDLDANRLASILSDIQTA